MALKSVPFSSPVMIPRISCGELMAARSKLRVEMKGRRGSVVMVFQPFKEGKSEAYVILVEKMVSDALVWWRCGCCNWLLMELQQLAVDLGQERKELQDARCCGIEGRSADCTTMVLWLLIWGYCNCTGQCLRAG